MFRLLCVIILACSELDTKAQNSKETSSDQEFKESVDFLMDFLKVSPKSYEATFSPPKATNHDEQCPDAKYQKGYNISLIFVFIFIPIILIACAVIVKLLCKMKYY